MKRATKVAIVLGGYVAAIIAGMVTAWLYNLRMAEMPYDTSGGMYAAGESMAAIGAFLVVALVPTLLGLWFVRRHAGFWNVVASAALGFSAAGLMSVLMFFVVEPGRSIMFLLASLLGLAQLLGVPLWALAFALFALLAPTRFARRTLVAAVGIELVIGILSVVHWFAPHAHV